MIVFDEKSHTYLNNVTNRPYISVSRLLGLYKEPFDRDFWSKKTAAKEGITQAEVLAKWDKNTKDACDKGTSVHDIVESYIKTDEVLDKSLIKALNEVFDKGDYKRVLSEELVYNDEYEVAGTSDIICDVDNDTFDVYDFKTNKKFLFENKYGKYLKTPLNNLQQCQYNDYSIQLSLYAFLYSRLTNKKVRKICILYHDGKKFHNYHTPYLFWEVSALLKHYSTNHGSSSVKQS